MTYGQVVRRAWPLLLAGLVLGGLGTAWLRVQGLPWFFAAGPLLVMVVSKVVGVAVAVRMLKEQQRS